MATTQILTPTRVARPRPPRTGRRTWTAAAREADIDRIASGSISELDEAHRRLKRNMQALAALLHLTAEGTDSADALNELTELEIWLQAEAARLRSGCRAGNFDQIALAVYVRQAARLWNTPPALPGEGGWSFDSSQSLAFQRLPDAPEAHPDDAGGITNHPATDLETALQRVPRVWRALARRALHACAVTFPPWFLHWRSANPLADREPRPSSELSVRLSANPDGLRVHVTLSGLGPGLSPRFMELHGAVLARQLASLLGGLAGTGRPGEESAGVAFEIALAGRHRAIALTAAA